MTHVILGVNLLLVELSKAELLGWLSVELLPRGYDKSYSEDVVLNARNTGCEEQGADDGSTAEHAGTGSPNTVVSKVAAMHHGECSAVSPFLLLPSPTVHRPVATVEH